MAAYPNFHPALEKWFEASQLKNPQIHTSCAGRGMRDQELVVNAGHSDAVWGKSAHNYNLALDLFQLNENGEARFEPSWYIQVIEPLLTSNLLWYGNERSYLEYPHVEIRNWRNLTSIFKLVE